MAPSYNPATFTPVGRVIPLKGSLVVLLALATSLVAAPQNSGYVREDHNTRVIVFVHGIFGKAESTWACPNGQSWPSLIAGDDSIKGADIYVANYPTPYVGNRMTIDEIVANLKNRLDGDGVFSKHNQVVFLAHSMGGLVVQRLLLTYRDLAKQVPFIYFFSTPNSGAEIATLAHAFSVDPLLKELLPGNQNDYLLNLEAEWRAASFQSIHRYCAYEKQPYLGVLIVDRLSSTRTCESAVPINANHVSIVKPCTTAADSYIAFRNAWKANPVPLPAPKAVASLVAPATTRRPSVKPVILKGAVLLDDLGGPGVPNATVSVLDGATRTVTDVDGRFTLAFPQKRPGELIRLIVAKEGYEVVNDIQLEQLLPEGDKPVIIIICLKGNREDMARRFYHLQSVEAIKASYNMRLEELQRTHADTVAEVESLRRQRDQAIEASTKVAEELAANAPGKTSQLYQDAMRQFLDGNIDQAIATLDKEKLNQRLRLAREKAAQAADDEMQVSQMWIARGSLLTVRFRFDEAIQCYEEVLPIWRGLEHTNPELYQGRLGTLLTHIGMLYRDRNHLEAARKYYNEALAIQRGLASKQPQLYEPDLAITLNDLGNLHSDQKVLEDARPTYYQEAINIWRKLIDRDPDTYYARLALTLNNLGNFYMEHNELASARSDYEESLHIRIQLALRAHDALSPDVAMSFDNLGTLNTLEGRLDVAEACYLKALEILEPLALSTPNIYQLQLAVTLKELGYLYARWDRKEQARKYVGSALDMFRRVASRDPKYRNEVGKLEEAIKELSK